MKVSLMWHRSSYSGQAGNCVEVAGDLPGVVGVRDSKDPDGPALVLTPQAWRAFIGQVKTGRLDLAAAVSNSRVSAREES